ncbi:MAG TPA: ATP-binding protein [Ktedonobacteraceae bacterium]|nr:ATP-binding protein [Ktedonobacteraceae bacterium]
MEQQSTATSPPTAVSKEAEHRSSQMSRGRELPPFLRRFASLRWRLAFIYIALFALFAFLISIFLYNTASTLLYADGQAALLQHTSRLKTLLINEVDCNNLPLSSAFKDAMLVVGSDDIDAVYTVDAQGHVLASSDGTLPHEQFPYLSRGVFSTAQNIATPQIFHLQQIRNGPVDAVLISLQAPPGSCANTRTTATDYLVVTTSYSVEQSTLTRLLLLIGLVAGTLTLLGAVLVFVITGYMLKPLVHMRDATQAIALGDLRQRTRLPHTDDEFGQLSTSIGHMIDQMEQSTISYRAAEQRARRFFSDASHQLRTPLTSIYGFTQLLLRGAKDDPATLNRVLRMMKNEAERMSRLVNDLLTLSRIDEGRALRMRYVDLVEIAIEAVEQAKLMATDRRSISLYLATEERLGVRADVDLLKQALVALFDNALKYGKQGPEGWIKLVLDKQDGQVIVRVIDNGNGIETDDLPHIFDRFYRGKNLPPLEGQTAPVAGTGLGLSIALAIVQAHQGTITASSSPSGEAARETAFTITLPSAD